MTDSSKNSNNNKPADKLKFNFDLQGRMQRL